MPLTLDRVGALTMAGERMSVLARHGDLTTPAIGLGRWSARDIVAHVGGIHRWAARIVRTRSMEGASSTRSRLDGAALCDWFDEGRLDLADVLAATDPEARCPNFNPGSRSIAGFWHRRQAHETTVHRWDLERALGATSPIDVDLATDGVEEYLDVFVRGRGTQTLLAPLVLTAVDHDRSWTVRPSARPGRVDVEAGAARDVATVLAGPAPTLLLHLWGRVPIDADGLSVTGDGAVAASFRG